MKNQRKGKSKPIQISLNARRFFVPGLTKADIPKAVAKLKKRGIRILKVNVKPSGDWKKGGTVD